MISDLSDFTFQIANHKGAYQTGTVFHRFKSFAIILMRERERACLVYCLCSLALPYGAIGYYQFVIVVFLEPYLLALFML